MKPKKYPYAGAKKRKQEHVEPLIIAHPIKMEKIETKIKVGSDYFHQGTKLTIEIYGYGKKIGLELSYPKILLSNVEATQIEMLFYKRLEELTTDKFMTFKESEWKSFCSELISKFRVLEDSK